MFGSSLGSIAAREAASESGVSALRLLSQLTDEQLETLDSAMGCLPITVREEIARYRKASGPGLVVGRLMDWNVPSMNNDDYRAICFGMVLSQRVMQRITVDALTSLCRQEETETLRFYRKGTDMEEVNVVPIRDVYPAAASFSPKDIPAEVYEKEGWWWFDYLFRDSKAAYDTQIGAVLIAAIGAELSVPFNTAQRMVYAAVSQVHSTESWRSSVLSSVIVVSAGAFTFWFHLARQAQAVTTYTEAYDIWQRYTKPEVARQVRSMYETGGPHGAAADEQLMVGSYMSNHEQASPYAEPEAGFLPIVSGLFSLAKGAGKQLKKLKGIKKAVGTQKKRLLGKLTKSAKRRKRRQAKAQAERRAGLPTADAGTLGVLGGPDDEYDAISPDEGNVVVGSEEGDAIGYSRPGTVADAQEALAE